jgi:acetyl-CoA acetyltransferase family protein
MNRVAVVGGCRTPFVKAGGAFKKHSFLDLGTHAVKGALEKSGISPDAIDELIYSTVLLDPRMPNAARELVLRSDLPKSLPAHFISNNCISGLVAANFVADGIKTGRISSGIAGGSESMSRPSLSVHPKAEELFIGLARAKTLGQRLSLLIKFKAKYLFPMPPSPKEPSTGLTMGQHCEITAKEFAIKREDQDALALASHHNAAKAQDAGHLGEEIVPLDGVDKDNIVRPDTSVEKLAGLRPVFDRSEKGTLTAGNSSPLTDGASAVVLMSEEKAKELDANILGFIDAVEFAAINPDAGLLMAPGLSLPRLMQKQNLSIDDVDLFEVHEAFAAQVLSNIEVWESGWDRFPELKAIGTIPREKVNPNGSSIAIGHPFAATGGRLIMATLNELARSNKQTGVISVCAAGAMGCAMLLRRS